MQHRHSASADIARYREISHRTDLYWRPYDNGPGPLHPSQPNGREQALDIRVYWTGAEKAALRSVAYRDSLGERVLGTSQHSSDFRDSIVREARTILQGPLVTSSNTSFGNSTNAESLLDSSYDRCRILMDRLLQELVQEEEARKKSLNHNE